MPRLYTIFIIKGISLWNWLSDIYMYSANKISTTYQFITNYMKGYHNIWFFLTGHTLPLSMIQCPPSIDYEWKYNVYTNQLYYHTSQPISSYSLSWLSAKLIINNGLTEMDMDSFLETFRIHTDASHLPTLETIFMAWSIYHKQWFPATVPIQFYIISDVGDEHIFSLCSLTNSTAHNHKIYITRRPIKLLSEYTEIYPSYKIDGAQSKEFNKKLPVDNI